MEVIYHIYIMYGRKEKTRTYDLIDYYGRVVYKGVTNNLKERFWEHKRSGKRFRYLRPTSRPLSWRAAEYKETGDLMRHKKRLGRKPRYNRTWNGKYNFGW